MSDDEKKGDPPESPDHLIKKALDAIARGRATLAHSPLLLVPTFDDDALKGAVARYEREYDRYLKLCARVAEICRDLVDGSVIRAQVTSRAKTPKSFEAKLRRIVAGKKKPLTDIDSVFAHVRDLSAVRVATYEARHEAQIVEKICERFVTDTGATPTAEAKDYQSDPGRRDNFYRATHIEVCLPPNDLVGTYANVARVPCEIQVCSMMAHVWNEIEHDLAYKPYSGSLSTFERDQLKHLGMMVRTADGIISQLLVETDRRLAADAAKALPIADVYDFVGRLRPWFPGVNFGQHATALFEVLRPLRLNTTEAIRRQIDLPDPIADGAKARCDELRQRHAVFAMELDPDSSDLLFVALLPSIAKFIARSAGSTDPGIARLQLLARAFVDPDSTATGLDIAARMQLDHVLPMSRGGAATTGALDDSSLTPDMVQRKILGAYFASVKRYHKALLQRDRTARGKVVLSFGVDEAGHTVDPVVTGFDGPFRAGIAAEMQHWRFEIPRDANGRPTRASFEISMFLVPE